MPVLSPRRLARIAAPLAAVSVLAAGCGSNDPGTGGAGTASAPTTAPADTASTNKAAVDAAFLREMIPHHELAIEMAGYAPSRANHSQVLQLAQRISTTQKQEVTEMTAAAKRLGVKLTDGGAMPAMDQMDADAATLGIPSTSLGMSMDMAALKTARPFDKAWVTDMIPHHEGAITMARAEVAHGGDPEVKGIAAGIAATQNAEIVQLAHWRLSWYPNKS